jgi:demethylmenaquinone methyltransferase / 2-methoxy-6-polyprenyl-1,4-benzoquinol methylase
MTPEAAERDPAAVRAMFDRVAGRYDVANHLLSAGCDFWWRHRASEIVRQWRPRTILDLATGSGDLALALARKLPAAEVIGADFSPEMLSRARIKGLKSTILADALSLPFPDNSFETVTIAFGLRNMKDWGAALEEMARVLRPGGHLLILDFSVPAGAVSHVYRFYLHRCLPLAARWITGEKKAYSYLGASIENFPSGNAMIELIETHALTAARSLRLTGGIASIYCAQKRRATAATEPASAS